MNKDSFLWHVKSNRDCDTTLLDNAVNKGLSRAKSDTLDSGKLLRLAAACVFTLAICFMVTLNPFESLTERYYQNWQKSMPGTAEALDGYINDITYVLEKYLGGN